MEDYQIKALGEIAQALITSMGMQAENMQRQQQGDSMAYDDSAFFEQVQVIEGVLINMGVKPR